MTWVKGPAGGNLLGDNRVRVGCVHGLGGGQARCWHGGGQLSDLGEGAGGGILVGDSRAPAIRIRFIFEICSAVMGMGLVASSAAPGRGGVLSAARWEVAVPSEERYLTYTQ